MPKTPIFITGNQSKADYLSQTLGISLTHHKLDVDEIQSPDPHVVIEHKVRRAYGLLGQPVLVEDTSLSFSVLNGLPGTFIKFFVDTTDGLENVCRMLDGFDDRSACASAVFGYYDGVQLRFFAGKLDGVIATSPRGDGGFGWGKIFEPDGYNGKTRAELSSEDYLKSYNQFKDFAGLREFLQSGDDQADVALRSI